MTKYIRLAVIFFISVYYGIYIEIVSAQTIFPSRKDLIVDIGVKIIPTKDRLLEYNYTFSNRRDSRQTIYNIYIQARGIQGRIIVPEDWSGVYADPNRIGLGYLPNVNLRKFYAFRPGLYRDDDAITNPPLNSIDPSESSDEFYLLDHAGPPVIVWWEIEGWAPKPYRDWQRGVIVSGNYEFSIAEWNDSYLYHRKTLPNGDDRENRLKGYTLGPSVPVADLQTLSDTFLIDLMKQVDEAIELGWVKEDQRAVPAVARPEKGALPDDGTFYRYTATLGGARQDLLRGNVDSARKKLRAALKQVEAQRGKQLTDEAYYLIKLNVEYLIEKL